MRLKVLLGIVLAFLIASPIAVAQELLPPDEDEEKEEAPAEQEKLEQSAEIEKLIGQLNSDEWSVREGATKRLTEIGAPAVEAVEKLVDSENMELRLRARKILDALHYVTRADREKIEKEIELCLGGPVKPIDEETKKLIEGLSAEEWQTREDATKALIEKGLPIMPEMTKLLKSEDPEVKTRAEVIIKAIEENSKKKLEEQLAKSVNTVKEIKCASYYLVETLSTKKEERREKVITKMLMGCVDLKGSEDAMGGIRVNPRGGNVTRTVIIMGGKKRVFVNGEEITALGKNPSPDRVLVAIVADDKKEMDLRLESLEALKERKAECAVGELMKVLTKASGKLQLETAKTLRRITGQEFGPTEQSTLEEAEKSLEEWKKWWEENKKEQKYKFSEQSADDGDSTVKDAMKQLRRALGNDKEIKKRLEEALKKAGGVVEEEKKKEDEKKEEPKKEEKPAEPEKKEEKPSEPEKKREGGEDKSGDF
jgi:HEAT repeat protein